MYTTYLKMIKYNIEYVWKDFQQITLVLVADIQSNKELVTLCDEIYEDYSVKYKELSFYFFQTKDNALDYINLRFVVRNQSEKVFVDTHCKGHLLNYELTGRFSPPEHLKTYPEKFNSGR